MISKITQKALSVRSSESVGRCRCCLRQKLGASLGTGMLPGWRFSLYSQANSDFLGDLPNLLPHNGNERRET